MSETEENNYEEMEKRSGIEDETKDLENTSELEDETKDLENTSEFEDETKDLENTSEFEDETKDLENTCEFEDETKDLENTSEFEDENKEIETTNDSNDESQELEKMIDFEDEKRELEESNFVVEVKVEPEEINFYEEENDMELSSVELNKVQSAYEIHRHFEPCLAHHSQISDTLKKGKRNTKKIGKKNDLDRGIDMDLEHEQDTMEPKSVKKVTPKSRKRKTVTKQNTRKKCKKTDQGESEAQLGTGGTKAGGQQLRTRRKKRGTKNIKTRKNSKDIEDDDEDFGTSDLESNRPGTRIKKTGTKHANNKKKDSKDTGDAESGISDSEMGSPRPRTRRRKPRTKKKARSDNLPLKNTCYTCSKHFATESNLAEHIKWTHELNLETQLNTVDGNDQSETNDDDDGSIPEINSKDPNIESDTDQPTVSDTDHPTVSDTVHPTVSGTDHHTVSDTDCPAISDTDHHSVSDTDRPAVSDTDHHTVSDMDHPIIPEQSIESTNKDSNHLRSNQTQLENLDSQAESDAPSDNSHKNPKKESNKDASMETGKKDLFDSFSPDIVCLENISKSRAQCPYCERTFTSSHGVQNHVHFWCKQVPYRCFVCKKGLTYPNQPHVHLKPDSKHRKNYYVRKADINRTFSCSKCDEKFQYRVTLENHMLMCKPGRKNQQADRVDCNVCNKSFSKSYIDKHMTLHCDEKCHICEFCGEALPTSSRLYCHVQSFHTKVKKFKCQYCSAQYTQKSALEYHQNVIFGKCKGDLSNKAFFKCKLCSRQFTSLRWLARHQEIHKMDESKGLIIGADFACQFCDRKFTARHMLLRHVKIHTNEKQFKCDKCDMAFVQKVNLNAHIKTHTGEKPYQCEYCAKRFIQKSGLKTHLKKHTLEEKEATIYEDRKEIVKTKAKVMKRKMVDQECQTLEIKQTKAARTLEFSQPVIFKVVTDGDSISLEKIPSEDIEIIPESIVDSEQN